LLILADEAETKRGLCHYFEQNARSVVRQLIEWHGVLYEFGSRVVIVLLVVLSALIELDRIGGYL